MLRDFGIRVAVLLGLAVTGCGIGRQSSPEVAFVPQSLSWRDPGCDSADCADVVVEYPEITRAPAPAARESLQAFVRSFAFRPIDDSTRSNDFEGLVANFRDAYDGFRNELPEPSAPWHVSRKVAVLPAPPGVFSMSCQEFTFMGGAHPNALVRLASFDARTGKRLRMPDLLAAGSEDALRAAGEKAFRQVRQILDDLPINEAGFWFENGRFQVPENFAVTADGIQFVFNPYDVAPYVMGPTEFAVPYSDIRPLLRTDGPLATQVTEPR